MLCVYTYEKVVRVTNGPMSRRTFLCALFGKYIQQFAFAYDLQTQSTADAVYQPHPFKNFSQRHASFFFREPSVQLRVANFKKFKRAFLNEPKIRASNMSIVILFEKLSQWTTGFLKIERKFPFPSL